MGDNGLPDDASAPKRAELLRLISETKSEAARIETLGKAIASEARSFRDLGEVTEDIYRSIPDDINEFADVVRLTESWRSLKSAMEAFTPSLTVFSVTGRATASTAMSEVWRVDTSLAWHSPEIEDAKDRLITYQQHPDLMAELHSAMQRLRLDSGSHGRRSPADLLDEAEQALLLPVIGDGGPTSTLIPIRECIEGTFSAVLARRPRQEPAKKWGDKVSSIATQCGHLGIAQDVVERLAEDAGMLTDELSGAKQGEFSRRELRHLFYRGAWFLKAFLALIDEQRLRPSNECVEELPLIEERLSRPAGRH